MATTTSQINDLIGWMRENKRAARAARFLVEFFDVVCQMTSWNFHIWSSDNKAFYMNTIRAKQAKGHFAGSSVYKEPVTHGWCKKKKEGKTPR